MDLERVDWRRGGKPQDKIGRFARPRVYVQSCSVNGCLGQCSVAVKRPHDPNNSYKGNHLIGAGLQSQRLSPLSSWRRSMAVETCAIEGAESSTPRSSGGRERATLDQPTPSDRPHLLILPR